MEETESDENDEVWLSDEVEAAELELCEVAEEEEEISGWELSDDVDDVIEEEDDSAEEISAEDEDDSEFKLELLELLSSLEN